MRLQKNRHQANVQPKIGNSNSLKRQKVDLKKMCDIHGQHVIAALPCDSCDAGTWRLVALGSEGRGVHRLQKAKPISLLASTLSFTFWSFSLLRLARIAAPSELLLPPAKQAHPTSSSPPHYLPRAVIFTRSSSVWFLAIVLTNEPALAPARHAPMLIASSC